MGQPVLLDPCAGDGEAIRTLRSLWAESYAATDDPYDWRRPRRPRIVACELEAERAASLRASLLDPEDEVHHADAFRLHATARGEDGASVLFLNPPYDLDTELGRLEHRFLRRFGEHVAPGGALLFLVPFHALASCSAYLAERFTDLRAWRLPEPEYSQFRQVLLVGRRAERSLYGKPMLSWLRQWAEEPERLPALPEACPEPLELDLGGRSYPALTFTVEPRDFGAVLDAFRPWEDAPVGTSHSARHLIGSTSETAMPPRAAHIALALASGVFNGQALEPNDPGLHPRLLAKGVFLREQVRVSERHDEDGDLSSAIEIEQPKLHLTVLRLDSYGFHELAHGTVPSGSSDIAEWNAADLILHYDRSLARVLAKQFPPLHDPTDEEGRIALPSLARRPFRIQREAIQAALKLLASGRNPFLDAEVGTGKSTMALYVAAALSPAHHDATSAELERLGFPEPPRVERTLILAPPHLMQSWTDQIAAVLPEARSIVVRGAGDLRQPADFYVLSRETAKLGHAYRGLSRACPRCGAPILTTAAANASRRLRCKVPARRAANIEARQAEELAVRLARSFPDDDLVKILAPGPLLVRIERLRGCRRGAPESGSGPGPGELEELRQLWRAGAWVEGPPCGEPLYQAEPRPRRFPVAKLIERRFRRLFQLVVVDEGHELNREESAQSKAAHRLTGLPGVSTIVLTGSLMGGYAGSLFTNFWALSSRFRDEFGRDDKPAFVGRYGYRKTLLSLRDREEGERGACTDRELKRTVIGEAPGILPTFILKHLLPTAVVVHKSDLDAELPVLEERPVAIVATEADSAAEELLAEYRRLQMLLLARIRADRFRPKRAGRLLGALVELPSYLDRCTEDLPPFELRYPEEAGGEWIATGRSFPAGWRTPKEAWLLAQVEAALARGERTLVFLRHTGTGELPRRLIRLLEEATSKVAWIDAKKVPAAKREAWIDEHVLGKGVQVLLVNPNAVRTGLNNLVAFSTGIWYELDYSATTYRQANGRLHRIGQTRPVTILVPFYQRTAQEVAMGLVARKVSASLQVDGLDLQAALEAAGASAEHAAARATAMSIGQAVYEALTRGGEAEFT